MTATKKSTQVATMIDALRKSEEPVALSVLCDTAEVKYPQDVNAALLALEYVGLITRAESGAPVYTWVGERSAPKRRAAAKTS